MKKILNIIFNALKFSVFYFPFSLYAGNYDSYVVSPYKPKSYPKLYKTWGNDWMKKINDLKTPAADYVSQQKGCDRVDVLDVSESKSTPKKNIVFFADCVNGARFYVSENDIKSKNKIQSQSEKSTLISDFEAISMCETELKRKLIIPAAYNRKIFTSNVYRAQTTGNIVVNFDFEGMNSLGAKLPKSTRCVISNSNIEITIK